MVNGERLTLEVERERGKVTTWGKRDGVASKHSAATPLVRSWKLGARSLKIGAREIEWEKEKRLW